MNYRDYFAKILLEDTDLGNPSHDNNGNDDISNFLDDGTESDAFDTSGIQDSLKKIETNFDEKMALLDNIDGLDKNEINSRLEQLEEYLTTLRAFVDTKDEVDMSNPYSIMANIIRSDTVKKTNFDQVTKAIEDYKTSSKKEEQATEQAAREVKDSLSNLSKARKSVNSSSQGSAPKEPSGPYN
jgi:hypothetical protein